MDTTFYRQLLETMYDGVYFVDTHRRITYWNKGAERLSGYSKADVLGLSCSDNLLRHVDCEGRELCTEGCPLAATIADGAVRETELFMHHKNGHRVPVFVRATPMRDPTTQAVVGAVEVFTSNEKTLQVLDAMKKLQQEALLDALTGIGNRRFADLQLDNHMRAFAGHRVNFGLLFIDLDHFKRINDTLGHAVGDRVLQMAAKTLINALRPLDVACRWGGEEFIAMTPNVDVDALAIIAERIRMLIEHSWLEADGQMIRVTASIGGTPIQPGDTPESLMARADQCVYLAKSGGRNRIVVRSG